MQQASSQALCRHSLIQSFQPHSLGRSLLSSYFTRKKLRQRTKPLNHDFIMLREILFRRSDLLVCPFCLTGEEEVVGHVTEQHRVEPGRQRPCALGLGQHLGTGQTLSQCLLKWKDVRMNGHMWRISDVVCRSWSECGRGSKRPGSEAGGTKAAISCQGAWSSIQR